MPTQNHASSYKPFTHPRDWRPKWQKDKKLGAGKSLLLSCRPFTHLPRAETPLTLVTTHVLKNSLGPVSMQLCTEQLNLIVRSFAQHT